MSSRTSGGETLRRLRKERGLSALDLSHSAGVSPTTLSHLENDQTPQPRRETVLRILDELDRKTPIPALERAAFLRHYGLASPEPGFFVANDPRVVQRHACELPPGFVLDGLDVDEIGEETLATLPSAQAIVEMNLRVPRWRSRGINALCRLSGLTHREVIVYCEAAPHIIASPVFKDGCNIYYGLRRRVLHRFKHRSQYDEEMRRYLVFIMIHSNPVYPRGLAEFFVSFYRSGIKERQWHHATE